MNRLEHFHRLSDGDLDLLCYLIQLKVPKTSIADLLFLLQNNHEHVFNRAEILIGQT